MTQFGGHDEGLYPQTPPGHAVPDPLPLVEFKSWHLPRKQWVRREQWGLQTKKLLRDLGQLDRPIRYLGLPGTELLDIEVLASVCESFRARLRYLGFNTGSQSPGEQTTQQLAEDAVKSLPSVDEKSLVTTDDILALSSKRSLATQRLQDFESFDIVNLDLCDVFTSVPGKPVHSAVKNILEYQANNRAQDWLLFVTTAIDRDVFAAEDIRGYRDLCIANAKQSQEFREGLLRLKQLDATPASVEIPISDPFDGAVGAHFGRVLSVGLGKWLLAVSRRPVPWKVKLTSCACYRRGLKDVPDGQAPVSEPELISLVFRLTRAQCHLVDETNLATNARVVPDEDWDLIERTSAVQIVNKACNTIDLDRLMEAASAELREGMIEESAKMLALRNYDPGVYREWARNIPRIPA